MKTLPLKLRKNSFNYTQVLRGQRSCIYAQEVSENTVCFEVFIIKVKPGRMIFGKIIDQTEVYPNNEAFGYWAWTYRTYESALEKYKELERAESYD